MSGGVFLLNQKSRRSLEDYLRPSRKMLYLGGIFSTLTLIFWVAWSACFGKVPIITSFPDLHGGHWYLPFDISMWLSIPYVGLMAAFIAFLFHEAWSNVDLSSLGTSVFLTPFAAGGAGFCFSVVAGWFDKIFIDADILPGVDLGGAIALSSFTVFVVLLLFLKVFKIIDFEVWHIQDWALMSLYGLASGFGIVFGLSIMGVISDGMASTGPLSMIMMGVAFACLTPFALFLVLLIAACLIGPFISIGVLLLKAIVSISNSVSG